MQVVVPPVLVDGVIAMMEATKILQGNPSTEFELIPLDVSMWHWPGRLRAL